MAHFLSPLGDALLCSLKAHGKIVSTKTLGYSGLNGKARSLAGRCTAIYMQQMAVALQITVHLGQDDNLLVHLLGVCLIGMPSLSTVAYCVQNHASASTRLASTSARAKTCTQQSPPLPPPHSYTAGHVVASA